MSDEEAFLAAIAANPDDEAPRLVFADWQEERGDPRGPWLRDPELAPWMGPRCENPAPRLVDALGSVDGHILALLRRVGGAAIPALLTALRQPEDDRRQGVCEVLVALADDLMAYRPQLEDEANSPDPAVRAAALAALGCLQDGEALAPLIARLENSDPAVRDGALRAVGDLGTAAAGVVPHIIRLWKREAEGRTGTDFRRSVAPVLGRIAPVAVEALPLLVSALNHPVLAPGMPEAIGPFGNEAVRPLLAALGTLDPTGGRLAIDALAQAIPDPAAVLVEALRDPGTPVRARRAILDAVADGLLGWAAEFADTLVRHLGHDDPGVCRSAAGAVAALGPAAARALPALARLARDPDPDLRTAAIRAAARVSRDTEGERAVLRGGLADPARPVRVSAWTAYLDAGLLGPLVRDLRALSDHDDPDRRLAAVEGLGRLLGYTGSNPGDPAPAHDLLADLTDERVHKAHGDAMSLLLKTVGDRSRAVRRAATAVLATCLPQKVEAAFPPLIEALSDPDPAVREQAAVAISRLELVSEPAIRACLDLLRDEDAGVICGALAALGTMREDRPDIDRRVAPFLCDREARVRAAAGRALATWSGPNIDVRDDALDLAADRNDDARAAGIRLLSRLDADALGDRLINRLRRALRDPHGPVRAAAIDALSGRSAEFVQQLQPDLVEALRVEADPKLADELASALRYHCPDRSADLGALLDDPDPAVRLRGLAALSWVGPPVGPLVPRLVAELDRNLPETRLPALNALGRVGPAAAPAVAHLERFLADEGTEEQAAALEVAATLQEAGAPLVARLDALAATPDGPNRVAAIRARAALAGWCPAAVPGTRAALRDENTWVVRTALTGLAEVGPRRGPFVSDVVPHLAHPDSDVRQFAARALNKFGPAAAPAVPALIAAVESEAEWSPRQECIEALGAIGPAAAAAIPVIARAAGHEREEQVRGYAVQALGKIGSAAGVPALRKALYDRDGYVRESAAQALAALGPVAVEALPDVCRALLDRKWDRTDDFLTSHGYDRRLFLLDAVEAMKTAADPVLPTLQKLLDDSNFLIPTRAVEVLAALGPAAVPVLRRALKHRDEGVRESARQALDGGV